MTAFAPGSDEARARAKMARERQLQLAALNKHEMAQLSESLIASLQREVTPMERIQAEVIASIIIRSRRLLDQGRDTTALRRELARTVRNSPWFAEEQPSSPSPTGPSSPAAE